MKSLQLIAAVTALLASTLSLSAVSDPAATEVPAISFESSLAELQAEVDNRMLLDIAAVMRDLNAGLSTSTAIEPPSAAMPIDVAELTAQMAVEAEESLTQLIEAEGAGS